ncbi:MAG: maltose acetyltransferase domain-containing protein [Rikenellaceae bacterium]
MTEKEKMIKGELYDAGDVTLVAERTTCKELCYDDIRIAKFFKLDPQNILT